MPYVTYWKDKGISWVFSGEITGIELIQANQDIYDDDRFLSLTYQIADFRKVVDFNVSSAAINTVAQLDETAAERNREIKVAIIANSDLIRGFSRMWELSGGGTYWETNIFTDGQDARVWLMQVTRN